MITPELPPLRLCGAAHIPEHEEWETLATAKSMAERERILLARVAELERLWQSAEARYAEADAAAMSHAKRIAELEARP